MQLSFIISQARSGELAALSAKDKTDAKIIDYINLALIALYNKFLLGVDEAIVTLRPDIPKTVYTMDETDDDVIVDGSAMPVDDFMSIITAYNEDGTEIDINNDADPYSIFSVTYKKLQMPLLDKNTYVSVIYRQNPTLITYTSDDAGNTIDTTVDLPMQLLEPLLHYIGYRAYGSINSNIQAENSTHYTRFIKACDDVEKSGVLTAENIKNEFLKTKGFI